MLKVRERVCMPSRLPNFVLFSHVTALRSAVNHSNPFSRNGRSLSNPGPADMAILPQY